MSKLKLSPNLFLEVVELENFRRFMTDEGYKALIQALVTQYGVVRSHDENAFAVTASTTPGIINVAAGVAFDANLDRIELPEALELPVTETENKLWVVLRRAVSNAEQGTVSVTADGTLTGEGTSFLSVLRGGGNYPNKVKFIDSVKNQLDYEVINVTSDTAAVIAAPDVAESDMRYAVVGAFTPGFQPTADNKLIYEHDSYEISIIDSETAPEVEEGIEFIIAQLNWSSGGMSVVDMRDSCTFNVAPVENIAAATNNIVSVVDVQRYGGTLRIGVQNAYFVTSFEVNTGANTFRIVSGNNNVLGNVTSGAGNVPDNIFAGWVLFNRATGKSTKITKNVGTLLTVNAWSADIALGTAADEFVIVPAVDEIEYEIAASGATTYGGVKTSVKCSVSAGMTNIFLPIMTGQTTFTLRYRDITGAQATAFKAFPEASYMDRIAGTSKLLMNSVLTVNANV